MSSGVSRAWPISCQDHLALTFDFVGRKTGDLYQDIAKNIERDKLHQLLTLAHEKPVWLAAGVSIENAADGFNLLGQALCGAPCGALKGHVFEHVETPISLGFSLREPVSTQTPSAALSRPGIGSVITLNPLANIDISGFIPPV